MTITLPPFSGDESCCAKCGQAGASTAYRAEGDPRIGNFLALPSRDRVERLQRHCLRCGFVWDEAIVQPATATEPTP